jgi:hypothetical protein
MAAGWEPSGRFIPATRAPYIELSGAQIKRAPNTPSNIQEFRTECPAAVSATTGLEET